MTAGAWLCSGLAGAAALACLVGVFLALRRRRRLSALLGALASSLLASLAVLFALLALSVRGYEALLREEVAAQVHILPDGPQRFQVYIRLSNGRHMFSRMKGDELYLDARILKWKPWANLLGLHTAYELDRVGGRYKKLSDERARPRSINSLAPQRRFDIFELRHRFALLSPLVDADYGSATFISALEPGRWEVLVSTTGLLARPLAND